MAMRAFGIAAGIFSTIVPLFAATQSLAAGDGTGAARASRVGLRPLIIRVPGPERAALRDPRLRHQPRVLEDDNQPALTVLSIGPLTAKLGGTATKAHIVRYRLKGLNVLGGSLSGTVDRHGALLYLRWPPNQDD